MMTKPDAAGGRPHGCPQHCWEVLQPRETHPWQEQPGNLPWQSSDAWASAWLSLQSCPAPNGLGKLRNLISYFTICPLRQQLLEEKQLCCSRGCLSPGEHEEERQQLPLATQPAGNRPLHTPKLGLNCKCTLFFWRKAWERERNAKG